MHTRKITLGAGRPVTLHLHNGRNVSGILSWIGLNLSRQWDVCIRPHGETQSTLVAADRVNRVTGADAAAISWEELMGDAAADLDQTESGTMDAARTAPQVLEWQAPPPGLRPFVRLCAGLFVWIGIIVMVLFGVVGLVALADGGIGGSLMAALIGLASGASITLIGGSTYVLCQIADMLATKR